MRVNDAASGPGKAGITNRNPKSMVIRMGAGEVGSSVGQLVKDVRAMMEPDTASRLKVRKTSWVTQTAAKSSAHRSGDPTSSKTTLPWPALSG